MDTWTRITNGREALSDHLAGLPADDWSRPSLCAGWTVKDVAAAPPKVTEVAQVKLVPAMVMYDVGASE